MKHIGRFYMQFRHLVVTAAILLFLGNCLSYVYAQTHQDIKLERRYTGKGYSLCGSCSVPKEIGSQVWLTTDKEPGDHTIISGTVFKSDGITPDSGITMFLYQTDAGGYYHRPKEDVFHPRLFGWIRTKSDGRYEIHTIKPAPEILVPNEPAHIHVHIFGQGMQEHFLHEFWFQGDERISPEDIKRYSALDSFSPIIVLTKGEDGIWKGTRNIRVRPAPQWKYEKD